MLRCGVKGSLLCVAWESCVGSPGLPGFLPSSATGCLLCGTAIVAGFVPPSITLKENFSEHE
jgi:hypothetical protein